MSTSGGKTNKRQPKEPPTRVAEWLKFLKRRIVALHLTRRPREDDLVRLAGLLTLIGNVGEEHAQQTFWQLCGLFLHPQRIGKLGAALDKIPPEPTVVDRLLLGLTTWTRLTGRTLDKERFQLDQVVEVLVAVPEPEIYVRHLVGKDMLPLGVMFHPKVLARSRKELRGSFGGTGGEEGYWKRTLSQLNVVND